MGEYTLMFVVFVAGVIIYGFARWFSRSAVTASQNDQDMSDLLRVVFAEVEKQLHQREAALEAMRRQLAQITSDSAMQKRLSKIVQYANDVFGNVESAASWLTKDKRSLDGARPIDYLDTDEHSQLIYEMLIRIDEGMAG